MLGLGHGWGGGVGWVETLSPGPGNDLAPGQALAGPVAVGVEGDVECWWACVGGLGGYDWGACGCEDDQQLQDDSAMMADR